jgi:hypothetical protein
VREVVRLVARLHLRDARAFIARRQVIVEARAVELLHAGVDVRKQQRAGALGQTELRAHAPRCGHHVRAAVLQRAVEIEPDEDFV